jgi:hypothetical protein
MVNSFDQKAHIITLKSSTKSRPLNPFKNTKEISKRKKRGKLMDKHLLLLLCVGGGKQKRKKERVKE